jgi:pilus assembly protein CpaE
VITVFSPKGGSGKTTIATNLSIALNRTGRRVCLIDLDLEFGDVAISLRLTPVRTLVDAVVAEAGYAHGDVQALVIAYADGMDCILAPVEPGEAGKIPVKLVTDLVGQLRERYDYIVIDTPSQFSEHVLAALDVSDHHVLLTNPEFPALKNLRLTLDMFDLLGYDPGRRSIIFNRDDAAVGLTAADAEAALNSPLAVHVPASRDVTASINRGVPIVAAKPDHPVSAAIRGFARSLADEPVRHIKRSGRRTRFLRRRAG